MNDLIALPVGWILTTIGLLGSVIATLAGIIYSSLSARIATQDKIIKRLQEDIGRMSKGCGLQGCHWKAR
jgi:hypothetical protein